MRSIKEETLAYIFILPALSIIFIFHIVPALYALRISLYSWDMISSVKEFVGLKNYILLLYDKEFWKSLFNTVYFTLGVVPLSILISLVIALFLNTKIRGLSFYRSVYFLPVVTSMNAVAMVWLWIYNPDYGILNYLLGKIGISSQKWLLSPYLAMPAVILMSIWKSLGYNIVIYLVGLQNIPEEYYSAAQVDGGGRFAMLKHITVPLLMPTTFFIITVSFISAFHTFTQIYMLTPDGGPLKSTSLIVYYLYQNAFVFFKMGYASAMAFVLFIIMFLFTLLQHKFLEKRIHYEI
ncbi:MAG: sugar ABC transporter permease [Candidatus Firestonebacteria bacterium]